MKPIRLLIVVTFLFFGNFMDAQSPLSADQVPDVVKTNFKQKFPGVKVHSWNSDDEGYAVMCKSEGKKTEIIFDKDGNYVSTKTEVKKDEVPVPVLVGLHSTQFNDWNLHNIDFVETSTNRNFYEVVMKKGKEVQQLVFDSEGNQVNKE